MESTGGSQRVGNPCVQQKNFRSSSRWGVGAAKGGKRDPNIEGDRANKRASGGRNGRKVPGTQGSRKGVTVSREWIGGDDGLGRGGMTREKSRQKGVKRKFAQGGGIQYKSGLTATQPKKKKKKP